VGASATAEDGLPVSSTTGKLALSDIEELLTSASSEAAIAGRGKSAPKPLRVSSKKAAGLKYRIVLMASIDFGFNGLNKTGNAQT